MHAQSFDEEDPCVFGSGKCVGGIAVLSMSGSSLGNANIEKGRLEAWDGDVHWVGYESELSWMRASSLQSSDMQMHIYHRNRTNKDSVFGRARFDLMCFPDNSVYKCTLPIETLPDEANKSVIIGSLTAQIQYISSPAIKALQLGDSMSLHAEDNNDLTLSVSYDYKDHTKGKFTVSLLAHDNTGLFLYHLDGLSKKIPAPPATTKMKMRCVEPNDAGRISNNPKHAEHEVCIQLDSVEDHISAFFLVISADKRLSTLQDVDSIQCLALNSATGDGVAKYDVMMRRPATAMMFARLVRIKHSDGGTEWKFGAFSEMEFKAHNFGYLIPNCMNTLLDGSVEGAIEGTKEHRLVSLNAGDVFNMDDCFNDGDRMTDEFSLGLQWDMVEGQTLDLDLGCVCLDEDMQLIDSCHFQQLLSQDGAIKHGGDTMIDAEDRDDDEIIEINLATVNPLTHYVAFYVTSYEGKKLNDVERCFAHFYVTATKRDIFTFIVDDGSDNPVFGANCAVLTTVIFKLDDKWYFKNAASGSNANLIVDSVPHLQAYIREHTLKETQRKILDEVPAGFKRMKSLQES
eukprot:CAMPEP_0114423528 /NCGR_PEP_ID=MMETSP0103-20121206/6196_1 /TAXON_ID=37642 ORGANISM="Paraphysomonas imperforata, Strain PA2" /NCGR_SAMPLE_ID=MMETSP0103 /ASSEMBLY_ACC=CAM_ASM_000201 /LENGTH=570 /DNA_ID=CAMNT_0001592195 /DNA_START=267 /DNA_END=1979 /DNA_ORIENTATION=-